MLDLILQQAGQSEPGFTCKTVKWAITCTREGRFTGVIPLAEGKGRSFEQCPNLTHPELISGGNIRAHFLVEALPTVALYWKDDLKLKEQEKFRAKHAFFRSLLEQAADAAGYLAGAAALLKDPKSLEEIRKELAQQKAKFTETATFLIDGVNPLEQSDWHEWWRNFRQSLQGKKSSGCKMRCVVTGDFIEPIMTHPKIKGLAGVGGLGTGDVVIGFDKQAFQSYGLTQSANAAMAAETATAYAETLNRLIAEKSIKLGSTLAVYWYTASVAEEDDPLAWLQESSESTAAGAELKARQLLTAIQKGQRPDLAGHRYVALILSGQAGRVMVREIMQGSFEALTKNVHRWFKDLAIVSRDGKGLASTPKFFALLSAIEFLSLNGTVIRGINDVPAPLIREMWRSALSGGQIPASAMAKTLVRVRSDYVTDNPPLENRFALLKAYLLRKGDSSMQSALNPDHPNPAYHCGRLLAVLARLQKKALGDVGAGVVQRYYTAASQTPGLILGRLIANAKNHLGKLEGGLAWWYENQIADVMRPIRDSIPRTLTLEDQSLFALGYYQQLAALNSGKREDRSEKTTETDS